MKSALIIILVGIAASSAQLRTRLVDLRVDNFNPLDRRTFDGNYLVNNEFWIAGGPIFIYVNGGSEFSDDFLTRGAVYEIAKDTNGVIFTLENRYYGGSRPTEDTSVENLQWLTYHQIIADLTQFINFIKSNYYGTQDSRVILWGREIGGTLAVWARQKYPNLVNGVWASSAPLNNIVQNPDLMRNTFNTINSIGGPECGEVLRGAFRVIEEAIRVRNTTYVENRLRLCSPIDLDIEEDLARLFFGIAGEIGYTFVSNSRYPDIDEKCALMLENTEHPADNDLDAFARWFVDEYNRDTECLNYNNTDVVSTYQQTEWDTVSTTDGLRQNFWLRCTQLGQFSVANEGENHPFGWRFNMEFFRRWCADAFDQELFTFDFIEESVGRTNQFFGGLNPGVYRVFFTHGEMDPRRTLGPSEDLNENSPVSVMSLQSSGRDFGSPSETDYAVLIETKTRARELIIQWIFDSIEEDLTTPSTPGTTSEPEPANQ